jgi:hypothetical protein
MDKSFFVSFFKKESAFFFEKCGSQGATAEIKNFYMLESDRRARTSRLATLP